MTEENQRRLYNHYLSLLENPNPEKLRGTDTDFVIKQAKKNIEATLKVYPHFAEKTKSKEKK